MSDLEHIVQALAARVAELEDKLEIARLMASYGPAVDGGSAEAAAALWVEDGLYDAGIVKFESVAEIANMVNTDPHRQFINSGAAHIVSAPMIEVDGDRATAYCYQQVIFRDEATDGYRIWRTTANRWDWERTTDGWKITRRWNRPLDGTEHARAIFRRAFKPNKNADA